MSHFTRVQAEIRDLKALEKALSKMNLQLSHNTQCRYYYGSEMRENVVRLPGPYDMALVPNSTGSYQIEADFYDGHVARAIGENGSALMAQYAIEKLRIEAQKLGCKLYSGEKKGNFKVIDNNNPSSGKLEASITDDGEISFKAAGFKGKGCMKFQKLEEALGAVSSRKYTSEYYESPREREREKQYY